MKIKPCPTPTLPPPLQRPCSTWAWWPWGWRSCWSCATLSWWRGGSGWCMAAWQQGTPSRYCFSHVIATQTADLASFNGTFLGRVNDLHTWKFLAVRPADRLTDLDKIKSSDWSKVGMLYCWGGHRCWRARQGGHMLSRKKGKAELSYATLGFYFANIHGFTRPPAWIPCLFFIN